MIYKKRKTAANAAVFFKFVWMSSKLLNNELF